ncbi:MAG TPA: branched-chain amino acid ABC transporter substrate-binding protein [Alphaproteobacteria bacterium]|nr:branched-chain amino acid ABC transporter substrate-binding protein [Alphaproteobacteria bacterium]
MSKLLPQPRALGAALGVGLLAIAAAAGTAPARAAEKTVAIGIVLPLTGADAEAATRIEYGAKMAIAEANEKGGVAGYKLQAITFDTGTATAGQYDPAQAVTDVKQLIANPSVVANVGPMMSGSGKALSPVLSEADLATITPSSTNPDITDPKFAGQYRPNGKAVYFRTVTTDAYQGPNMANYYKDVLHVKSVYILDDSGAYGVGLANSFEAQAKKIGIKVLGHDELNPKEADYTTILTKIKALHPDALYYGGVAQAGVKLMKQSYDVIPKVIKGGGDGMVGPDLLKGAGFPAAEGWYATIASPHVLDEPQVKGWVARFVKRYNTQPDDYAITAYDATEVIIDAIKRVAASGKPMNRANIRDAIQNTHLNTLQGEIAFDKNGDMLNKVISVFQIKKDPKYADDDVLHQYKYVGVAPQSATS